MLKIDQLTKTYDHFSLHCSLEVRPGMITGLIGQNGAGKSTTFKAILGLIQKESGTITILGKDSMHFTPADREQVGVVLSDSGFSEYLTIQNLLPILGALYKQFDRTFFLEQVSHFQLPLNKRLKDFSTGMKAKLKVLIAISHHASLLILDEPTAGLDVIARDELLGMLKDFMAQDEHHAILISSHISSDLETLCDELYMIHNGEIRLHEDTDLLLSKYGVLKVSEQQYDQLDKDYLLSVQKEAFGYSCLTNERQFYMENYPDIAVEKGSIDATLTLMIKGEQP